MPSNMINLSEAVFTAIYYKERLDARQTGALASMTGYWTNIKQTLYSQAEMVAKEILDRYPNGGAPEEWINELNYYKSLMEQADNTTFKYANWSSAFAYEQIGNEYQYGHDNARDLIGLQNIGVLKGLAVPQIELLAGATQATSPLGKLFASIGIGGREQLSQALMNGLAKGLPMSGIAQLMVDSFNLPAIRASLIARTEINRAYRASTLMTYQTYGITKYKRMASKQRACMGCLMLDGQVYNSSHELDDHPNGACVMVPIVPGADEPEWEYGQEYFLGLSEEEQRKRMGNAYYESWQRGDFGLNDLARIQHNPIWGGSPQVIPLKELSPDWQSWFYGKGSGDIDKLSLNYLLENIEAPANKRLQGALEAGARLRNIYGNEPGTPEVEAWVQRPNIWYGESTKWGKTGKHPMGDSLQQQVLKSQLRDREILYRGGDISQYPSFKKGDGITFEQFTSTSTSRSIADFFKEIHQTDSPSLLFVIDAPAGTRGLFVHETAAEILLPAGSQIKILKIEGSTVFARIIGGT